MHNFRVTVNGKVFEVTVEEADSAKNEINTKAVEEAAAAVAPAKTGAAPVSIKDTVLGSGEQPVVAPLSGSILEIKVKIGDRVKFGQVLLTLEALKMENEIVAPQDGVVKNIFVQQGSMVNVGDVLLSLTD
ncbi:MAG: biotin/lipoyl-binding protein [Firmicutes bacterium]|nr:biotin/lipoyl-binding protein [Bacillota bacterium]